MKQIKTSLLLLLCLIYLLFIFLKFDENSRESDNPEYLHYIEKYRELTKRNISEYDKAKMNNTSAIHYGTKVSTGTTCNFEGPAVLLDGIKFHNHFYNKEQGPLKHFDGLSAHFDPDHTYYGLPDVQIHIQDVRLYSPSQSKLNQLFGLKGNDKPMPYKTYIKSLPPDSMGKKRTFEMQLWLTEFNVTIDIKPDLDIPVKIGHDEKESIKYPGYWYGSEKNWLYLSELRKENVNHRYGDLSFILKIIPDQSPFYIQTEEGNSSKPSFAIGAVYCSRAKIGTREKIQRISTNINSGQPVFLNHENNYEKLNRNNSKWLKNPLQMAEQLLDDKMNTNQFIWNKPYYMKLFFNNLGSWRSGIFNQNQYHDQVNYTFLMPLFVVGSWDVVMPTEILPEWDPPAPFIKEFSIKNLLPFWNGNLLSKLLNIGLIVLIIVIIVLNPGVINKLFKSVNLLHKSNSKR